MKRSFDPHPTGRPDFDPPDRDDAPDHAAYDVSGEPDPAEPPGPAWTERESLLAIVPPSGSLPRRFGAGRLNATMTRASVVVAIAGAGLAVAAFLAGDVLPESIAGPLVAAFVPLAGYAASALFGKRARMPLAVEFGYSGVSIVYAWTVRRFGWGELIGLAGALPKAGEWVLVARRGTREWRIPFDASKAWVASMLEELTGAPREEPPA